MFDATYFRTGLPAQMTTAGESATVELFLMTGQAHRVRSIAHVADGYVVLDVYQRSAEGVGATSPWQNNPNPGGDDKTHKAVVSFEAITQIVITPPAAVTNPRIGFGAA